VAANNSKRKQLEKRLADAQIYLKEYNRGDHSVVVSNLMSNKLERNIKKLEKQLAGMLPEITVTAKPKPSNNTTAKQRRTAIEGAGYNLKPKTPTKPKPKPKPKTGRSGMGNEDYQGGMSVQSKAKRAQDKKARVALEAKDKANAAKKKATAQRRKAVEGAGYNLTEKKKKSSSRSGTGMNAYQNMNFNRRK